MVALDAAPHAASFHRGRAAGQLALHPKHFERSPNPNRIEPSPSPQVRPTPAQFSRHKAVSTRPFSPPLSHWKCECLVRTYHCRAGPSNLYKTWGNPRERDPRSAPENMSNKAATLPKSGNGSSRAHGGKRPATPAQQPGALARLDSFPSQLDFQLLFASHPEAMVVLDLDRRIRMCNPAFENLFQHREAEILGAELDVLLASDEHRGEALQFSQRAAAGEVLRANTRRRRRDGSFVDV